MTDMIAKGTFEKKVNKKVNQLPQIVTYYFVQHFRLTHLASV